MNLVFNIIIILPLLGLTTIVSAQSKTLLEACNALDDRTKRMECLEEAIKFPDRKNINSRDETAAIKRAKATFAAIASTVKSGISYKNYAILIIEPAKELGILQQEATSLDPLVFENLSRAVEAYNESVLNNTVLSPRQTGGHRERSAVPR
jgi:uncharacterized membrane protein